MSHKLLDAKSDKVLFPHLIIADNYLLRLRGYMFRKEIPADQALLLQHVWSIHTFFMLLPIDVIFIDKQMRVVKMVENLGTMRLSFAKGAYSTIECSNNSIKDKGIVCGQRLRIVRYD